ncbi:MAG: hypothetical protein WBG86_14390 [Polyangiales bacterium]
MANTAHTFITLTWLAVVAIAPASAHAQELGAIDVGNASSITSIEYESAVESANRQIRNGRILLGVSTVGMAGGVGMIVGGIFRDLCIFCDDDSPSGGGTALITVGALATVGGFAGTIAGGIVLRKGKGNKRELEQRRLQPELRIGAGNLSLKLAF